MGEMLDDSYGFVGLAGPSGLKDECRQIVARITGKTLETYSPHQDTKKKKTLWLGSVPVL